ncbi:recombinase family protein [Symmachiella dynata]|uniref:recombinase family protein n=1 Tax=Symmachiella dynata TaxID=2527995 RepID=UPI00119D8A89|nr:recombinase family protein [Symmachiella dynata]
MNVVIWTRVSSREQKEGYSIDAQLRVTREKAQRLGWNVVREFELDESAKRGAERKIFNEMLRWLAKNAKREKIKAILCHKLDRACRNMRDAVRLQELEDACGVQLSFVENEFGPGAAGTFSFNVMAAVAQYYSDNLREEVIKGLDEKVRQGWPTGLAPYGYINVDDRDEPIVPHPEKSKTLIRIFDLYSSGSHTFKSLADRLASEGHEFRDSQSRFNRTALSHILNNRFYIGELHRNGHVFEGRYQRVIHRATFDACQDILSGRKRRTGTYHLPLAGGLFRCEYCGQSITGERIRRKLKGGGIREHIYYRCCNNNRGPDHPKVRWKARDLEEAIAEDLEKMRMPTLEVADWFRKELWAAVHDLTGYRRQQATSFAKRKTELANMQDRLLNAYLAGTIDEEAYKAKSNELKAETASADESLDKLGDVDPARGELAVTLFDWTQKAAEIWRGSNNTVRRDILDAVCLNRVVSDVNLVLEKRKPFDTLAERPDLENSRGDRI